MKQKVKVIFDRRKLVEKKGTGFIDICVYLKAGERKYEIVGSAKPEEWEAVAQRNGAYAKVKHYESVIHAMEVFGEEMTIENFNKHVGVSNGHVTVAPDSKYLYKETDQRQNFVEFMETYLDKEALRDGSRRNVEVVIESLKKYKQIMTFADLTPSNLVKYDEWLHEQGDKSLATIYNYHKKVHKYTKILWRREMIPSDPYNHVSFKRGTSKERLPLTEEELLTLRQVELSPKLDRVRDLFIFMAYTGLAYIDMCHFNFETDTEKQGDTYYINGARIKTGTKFYAPILPPAMAVLKKYNFKLPIITNQKLNDYLDLVREKLDWKKKLTCHIGRHSFATLMVNKDVSMESTGKMLGQKDLRITQIYAKVLPSTIVQRVEAISPNIK